MSSRRPEQLIAALNEQRGAFKTFCGGCADGACLDCDCGPEGANESA
ncbi:MAG: hypothetical protein Q8M02_14480 [Candidatus Didemnitutus sp.]|nr:hypothetical protein [Candidatus Didemnitutus sp.]